MDLRNQYVLNRGVIRHEPTPSSNRTEYPAYRYNFLSLPVFHFLFTSFTFALRKRTNTHTIGQYSSKFYRAITSPLLLVLIYTALLEQQTVLL